MVFTLKAARELPLNVTVARSDGRVFECVCAQRVVFRMLTAQCNQPGEEGHYGALWCLQLRRGAGQWRNSSLVLHLLSGSSTPMVIFASWGIHLSGVHL